jgi:hypothetical protein
VKVDTTALVTLVMMGVITLAAITGVIALAAAIYLLFKS